MFFLFTRKLYLNTVNEIFVQFHSLSSYPNHRFLKKKQIRARAIGATRMKGVLSLEKRDAFQPRSPGFLLPVPTEQERALSLSLSLSLRRDG